MKLGTLKYTSSTMIEHHNFLLYVKYYSLHPQTGKCRYHLLSLRIAFKTCGDYHGKLHLYTRERSHTLENTEWYINTFNPQFLYFIEHCKRESKKMVKSWTTRTSSVKQSLLTWLCNQTDPGVYQFQTAD